jgi:predicted glycoside hydrolase/deacetylase ChbG (UPF0249 family)
LDVVHTLTTPRLDLSFSTGAARSSMTRYLIVNADDFGLSTATSQGIILAHCKGIVTSTTVIANMPGTEQALGLLIRAPALGVGLHLNFVDGRPLSSEGVALADDDGVMRRSAVKLAAACLFRPSLLRAIDRECEAQILWALDHGIRPTHLDSHRHGHAFFAIFRIVCRLARRYGIPFVRLPRERLPRGAWQRVPWISRRQRVLLNLIGLGDDLIGRGLVVTGGVWGITHTGIITRQWLLEATTHLPEGVTEFVTHPAEPETDRTVQACPAREAELKALCDPEVIAATRRNGIKLIHYGQLANMAVSSSGGS